MEQIDALVRRHDAQGVTLVRLKVGALARISADHLREHFVIAAHGTVAENAVLEIIEDADPDLGAGIILQSLELEV
jgi:hydrogenase nickel incorporation protein HypA/HybF